MSGISRLLSKFLLPAVVTILAAVPCLLVAGTAAYELEACNIAKDTEFRHELHCLAIRSQFNQALRSGRLLRMTKDEVSRLLPKTQVSRHDGSTKIHLLDRRISDRCTCYSDITSGVVIEYDSQNRVVAFRITADQCQHYCHVSWGGYRNALLEPMQLVIEAFGTSDEYCAHLQKKHRDYSDILMDRDKDWRVRRLAVHEMAQRAAFRIGVQCGVYCVAWYLLWSPLTLFAFVLILCSKFYPKIRHNIT